MQLNYLELAGSAEAGALLNLSLQDRVDLVVGMAADRRAPRANIVDVLVAVNIKAVSALDVVEHNGAATNRAESAHRRVHTARQQLLGLLEDLFGSGNAEDLVKRVVHLQCRECNSFRVRLQVGEPILDLPSPPPSAW